MTCFQKKLKKIQGRNFPGKGRNIPGKGRNFPVTFFTCLKNQKDAAFTCLKCCGLILVFSFGISALAHCLGWPFMSRQLPSRLFSSATFMEGLGLVKDEVGLDPLDDENDADLAEELKRMQVRG